MVANEICYRACLVAVGWEEGRSNFGPLRIAGRGDEEIQWLLHSESVSVDILAFQ